MTTMHMDTDRVDELGRTMIRSATDLKDQVDSLQYAIRRLQNSWLGDHADTTVNKISNISSELGSLADRMDHLAYLTIQESQQWMEADGSNQSIFSAWKQNLNYSFGDLREDLTKFGGAAYIISTLHGVAARPNSVAIHGPDWLLKSVGFGPNQRIMSASSIQKQLLGSSAALKGGAIAGIMDGINTGIDTFRNGEYAGTSRALPAAVVDGAVKGVVTGLVTAGLIALTGAIIGTAAAPVAVAAATIGVCVVGGSVINTFVVDPLFKAWQASHLHTQVVEEATRISNDVSNYFQYNVQAGIDRVRNSFSKFISIMAPAPA